MCLFLQIFVAVCHSRVTNAKIDTQRPHWFLARASAALKKTRTRGQHARAHTPVGAHAGTRARNALRPAYFFPPAADRQEEPLTTYELWQSGAAAGDAVVIGRQVIS